MNTLFARQIQKCKIEKALNFKLWYKFSDSLYHKFNHIRVRYIRFGRLTRNAAYQSSRFELFTRGSVKFHEDVQRSKYAALTNGTRVRGFCVLHRRAKQPRAGYTID